MFLVFLKIMSLKSIIFVVFQTQIINTNLGTLLKHSFMIILNTNAAEHYAFYVVVLRHLQIQIYIISSKITFHIYFPLYYQSRYYVYTFKIFIIYFRRLINLLSQIFTIKRVMYLTLVRICSNKWQIISLVFSSLPKFALLSLLLLSVDPLFLPNWLSSSSLSVSQY